MYKIVASWVNAILITFLSAYHQIRSLTRLCNTKCEVGLIRNKGDTFAMLFYVLSYVLTIPLMRLLSLKAPGRTPSEPCHVGIH